MNRGIKAGFAALAALAITVPAAAVPAGAQPTRSQVPGDAQLVNFAHVKNFQTQANATGHGTDIEFFTNAVPIRNYETGELLDAAGNPLPSGAPPVMHIRDFAVMGTYDGGGYVYDITDPENVQQVINIPCNQTQNDVQLKQFGDRWILALARDGTSNPCVTPHKGANGHAGIAVFDVTDPYEVVRMYSFRTTGGAHNFTFHPTKPYGWVSTGDLPGGPNNHIPIIDFTKLDEPKLAADIPSVGGPHDISFSADGLRAFVASENNYRIYNTTDPANPTEISITPNAGTYAHGFDPTPDRKIAVATNESLALGGFFAPRTTVCPGEGLTFFSVDGADEQRPKPVGQFLASAVGPISPTTGPALDDRACTGHVGKMANKALVTGWYVGGVRVVDFTNPALPIEAGIAVMPGAEVWSAKWYKGPYIYAADQRRGFDVFKWTGTSPAPWLA
jgi:hypothetical protein